MMQKNKLEAFWEENNKKINTAVGKLIVPVMRFNDPLLAQAHQDLINYMNWFDREMESLLEEPSERLGQ